MVYIKCINARPIGLTGSAGQTRLGRRYAGVPIWILQAEACQSGRRVVGTEQTRLLARHRLELPGEEGVDVAVGIAQCRVVVVVVGVRLTVDYGPGRLDRTLSLLLLPSPLRALAMRLSLQRRLSRGNDDVVGTNQRRRCCVEGGRRRHNIIVDEEEEENDEAVRRGR